jgi:hypothetical protein
MPQSPYLIESITYAFALGLSNALLIRSTIPPKLFSYMNLHSAPSSSSACFFVRACVTHSLPARTFGRKTAFVKSATGTPRRWQIRSATGCEVGGRKAWSDRSPVRCRLPIWRIRAGTRKSSSCSGSVKPTTRSASWENTISHASVSPYCQAHFQKSPLRQIINTVNLPPGLLQKVVLFGSAFEQ